MGYVKDKPKLSERKIVKAVSALLEKKGYNVRKEEVQFCERFIDILCWKNKSRSDIVAVEAKVKAPTKAFEQASRYRYIADYVYVAILRDSCNKKSIELSTSTGIGLIFVRRDSLDRYYATIEIKPKKSIYKDNGLVKYVLGDNYNIKLKRTS